MVVKHKLFCDDQNLSNVDNAEQKDAQTNQVSHRPNFQVFVKWNETLIKMKMIK